MKNFILFFLFTFSVISCRRNIEKEQPTILEKKCEFDLEKIKFNENVSLLYSKNVDIEDEILQDSIEIKKLPDSLFKYKISNIVTESFKFRVPQKDFGYLYKSPEIDSIAIFGKVNFNKLYCLTNLQKKPVAYFAETEFKDSKSRKIFIDSIIKKYGKPKYAFHISSNFNHSSREWELKEKTIQIETSTGFRMIAKSNEKANNETYYELNILIIDNRYKQNIINAHTLTVPDKINYNGKAYSYKRFQFPKTLKINDDFLLYSTSEAYAKDTLGVYNIDRENSDE
ncbi:hypothetical protein V3470_14215 [Flavobacterium oreochromis]|uniref:Lipoprotein n=1 Tax=Flavobacterium oreochromis TaxID=2906078 RepID=A0ABW8P8K1_9FLAO|nr:hypothetical protein [Flavobacterium oreochromis]OWP74194.1 hypothetical protein BWG23_14685 [Flavobacterium oreochromis]